MRWQMKSSKGSDGSCSRRRSMTYDQFQIPRCVFHLELPVVWDLAVSCPIHLSLNQRAAKLDIIEMAIFGVWVINKAGGKSSSFTKASYSRQLN